MFGYVPTKSDSGQSGLDPGYFVGLDPEYFVGLDPGHVIGLDTEYFVSV
jgi:hypothetical protein